MILNGLVSNYTVKQFKVHKATYKIIKIELVFNRIFESFEELEKDLYEYVNWYNTVRIHGSLNYLTPVEYKNIVNEENV